jgi:hypothetical protein
MDAELFFTEEDNSNYNNLDTVKRMCVSCSAKTECYNYALEHLVHGIWAGTTFNERDYIRKKRGINGKEIVDNVET